MALSRQSVERGASRLYWVAVIPYLIWIMLWLPMQVMAANDKGRLAVGQPLDNRSWGERWWAIMGTDGLAQEPLLMTFLVVGVPAIGYLLMIGGVRLCYWIAAGFRADSES